MCFVFFVLIAPATLLSLVTEVAKMCEHCMRKKTVRIAECKINISVCVYLIRHRSSLPDIYPLCINTIILVRV